MNHGVHSDEELPTDVPYTFFYSAPDGSQSLITGELVGRFVDENGAKQYICKTGVKTKDATGLFVVHHKMLVSPAPEVEMCPVCDGGLKVAWTGSDRDWPPFLYCLHGEWVKSKRPITRKFMHTHGLTLNDVAVSDGMTIKMDTQGEPYMIRIPDEDTPGGIDMGVDYEEDEEDDF